MRLGKNKKKQWRKCVPGIEEEIIKAKEVNDIDDISFDVSNTVASGKGKDMKYSTVPRRIIKRPNVRYPPKDVVDIWADDCVAPVLSKRRRKMLDEMVRYKKPSDAIHPGTSYQPLESDHVDLLQKMQVDYETTTNALRLAEKRMEINIDDETNNEGVDEEEDEMEREEGFVKKDPLRKVKLLTRREKKRKIWNLAKEKTMHFEKMKEKSEAHLLRNIPQVNKQIVQTTKEQTLRKKGREEKGDARKTAQAESKSLANMSFLLPSEVPTCLRRLIPENNLLSDIMEKFNVHKFKVDKKKKRMKLTKTVKKHGLVK